MLREISLHIHDLAENSISAGATRIDLSVCAQSDGFLCVMIQDNGCGMSQELLSRVTDPFTTGRTARKVGMGIPFFKLACEQAGGNFAIHSVLGKGTETAGSFQMDNIDRLPLGDLGETIMLLIMESPQTRYTLTLTSRNGTFVLDTDQIREVLDGTPIDSFEILQWIKGYVNDHALDIFGGVLNEIIRRA